MFASQKRKEIVGFLHLWGRTEALWRMVEKPGMSVSSVYFMNVSKETLLFRILKINHKAILDSFIVGSLVLLCFIGTYSPYKTENWYIN